MRVDFVDCFGLRGFVLDVDDICKSGNMHQ